ncbi:MAG: carboxypeptidase-like regulatory domain-containing protein, partial [Vicinamibacterales bacterium]
MDAFQLIGFVSDETYSAVPDASLEFHRNEQCLATVRSSASGAVYADLPQGEYRVTLACSGFGSKRVVATIDPAKPFQFRLLSNSLYGYAWPKWNRAGGSSEFRVHSPDEPYHLTLWRYGREKQFVRAIGWFDEHGPRANQQILPDGDFTQSG